MLQSIFRTDNEFSKFFLRLALSVVIFPHGAQKLFGIFGGHGLEGTLSFFQQQFGLDPILIWLLIITETLGAIAILLGFLTRIAAAGIATVMIWAMVLVHLPNGFFMNWYGTQQGEGFEFHLLAIGISLALLFGGGGRWSIDRRFIRKPYQSSYLH